MGTRQCAVDPRCTVTISCWCGIDPAPVERDRRERVSRSLVCVFSRTSPHRLHPPPPPIPMWRRIAPSSPTSFSSRAPSFPAARVPFTAPFFAPVFFCLPLPSEESSSSQFLSPARPPFPFSTLLFIIVFPAFVSSVIPSVLPRRGELLVVFFPPSAEVGLAASENWNYITVDLSPRTGDGGIVIHRMWGFVQRSETTPERFLGITKVKNLKIQFWTPKEFDFGNGVQVVSSFKSHISLEATSAKFHSHDKFLQDQFPC